MQGKLFLTLILTLSISLIPHIFADQSIGINLSPSQSTNPLTLFNSGGSPIYWVDPSGNLNLSLGQKIYFDNSANTYLIESSPSILDTYTGVNWETRVDGNLNNFKVTAIGNNAGIIFTPSPTGTQIGHIERQVNDMEYESFAANRFLSGGNVLMLNMTSTTMQDKFYSSSSPPTTSTLASGYCTDAQNTSTGIVSRICNNGGIMTTLASNPNSIHCDGVTDDTTAIQNAINSGNVVLPGGTCIISSTLTIGNGNNSTQSTIHDVFLSGQGFGSGGDISGYWATAGTILKWNGCNSCTMLAIKGPIFDVNISKIHLDGNNKAGYGIYAVHMTGSKFDQVRISRFTNTAFTLTINATSGISGVAFGSCSNVFNQLSTDIPSLSTSNGILLNGVLSSTLDACENMFIEPSIIYGGGTNSCGLILKFADNNIFQGGILFPSSNSGGKGVCMTQINGNFPQENHFSETAILQGISGVSGTGGNWFAPYPTSDGEPIPNIPYVHYMLYNGTIH